MKTPNHQTGSSLLSNTFGGLIYLSDYNTEHKSRKISRASAVANRIAQDKCFDAQCKRNTEIRKRSLR